MRIRRAKFIPAIISVGAVLLSALAAVPFVLYLKVLPWAVSNPKFISYAESYIKKTYDIDADIKNPVLQTEFSPLVRFKVGEVHIDSNNTPILNVKNFDTEISLAEIFNKRIVINSANLDSLYADVNKILDLPILKQEKKSQKNDWSIDVFQSVLSMKSLLIFYNLDKDTRLKLSAKNIKIDDNLSKKHVNYNLEADIDKAGNVLNIKTADNGNVYIENKENLVAKNCKITVNNSDIYFGGNIDKNYDFSFRVSAGKFSIPAVITLLNSQIVENNLSEQLAYFKDIDGNFDFDVKITNDTLNGDINLNKLSFKLIPLIDLPVLLTQGRVSLDSKNIVLEDFKGYYNNKPANAMDFEGTVKDYLKSVDTDLVGNAVITNDFSINYLSELIGYPMRIKGNADTRIMLKSKYNKIDLVWLCRFMKGNGFVVDGEEAFMNDAANRVLAAKMHFDNMLLNIKSLDYYAGNPSQDIKDKRIPILSMNGNIDFSDGKTFVKDFGLELPKPMPSGFINALMKQKLFKNGTFTGYIKLVNTGKYPVLEADLKADKVAVPSQRLFIKNGEFKTDNNYMHITSDGRYRRSAYNASGTIVNEMKFPIIVKNVMLSVDDVDVMKYLQLFNNQNPSEAAVDVQTAIADSVAKGGDVDDDDNTQTFDLANLVVEECILKAKKGFYKGIKFADVVAVLTLNKESQLNISTNSFEIAEGRSSAKINCDLKNHKYSIWLALKQVNSDIMATSLLNLTKEIDGKASGLIQLNTDDSLKLNGKIQFRVNNGTIGKVGLVEYVMKVAALFRNPLTMISPSVISDLVSVPEGRFDKIDGDILLKDNVVERMMIKSSAPQLSSFIIGRYNLENQDAALRIYTKFSNRRKGLYGVFRNISLNSLANRIPLSSRNDSNYYASEISNIPPIDADEKDCQIFLTKVDGDIEHNNFISSLKKIK